MFFYIIMNTKEMVNITDIGSKETIEIKDVLKFLLEKQSELMEKYGTKPVGEDIDTLKGSQQIRMFSKYTIEEMSEAYEAYLPTMEDTKDPHVIEEMMDSLHFFLEKILISNLNYEKIFYYLSKVKHFEKISNFDKLWERAGKWNLYNPIHSVLWTMTYYVNIPDNYLRNKERKKYQLPTNRKKFYESLSVSVYYFFWGLRKLWYSKDDIINVYNKKNNVNYFRIKSNY